MIINEVFIPYDFVPNNNKLISFSTKYSHDILNNNDQYTGNRIIIIPSTIDIGMSSLNSYSKKHSPMSEPRNRKIYKTNYVF